MNFQDSRLPSGPALADLFDGSPVKLFLGRTQVTSSEIAQLTGNRDIVLLDLHRTAIDDTAIETLCSLPNLELLSIAQTRVTNAGVATFLSRGKCLNHLKALGLSECNISDEAIVAIDNCPDLDTLWLGDTQVSDVSISTISKLKHIKHLELNGTRITGRCFADLLLLPELEIVWLERTGLTADDCEKFRLNRPSVKLKL